MDHLEKVEKLRKRADVNYEEAKKALEECDWNILDALILLESQGKVKVEPTEQYETPHEDQACESVQSEYQELVLCAAEDDSHRDGKHHGHDHFFAKLGRAIKYLVKKGCENSLVIKQHGQALMDLPIIAFIILLILFFWVVVPIMVISLFFDFSYNFKGEELGKEQINKTMDQATEAVNHFKTEINQKDKN